MPYLFEYALRVHTLPLIFCGIALDIRGIRRLLYGCGFALLGLLVACFKWGTMSEDRFIIPDTSLGNANDLGLRLLGERGPDGPHGHDCDHGAADEKRTQGLGHRLSPFLSGRRWRRRD